MLNYYVIVQQKIYKNIQTYTIFFLNNLIKTLHKLFYQMFAKNRKYSKFHYFNFFFQNSLTKNYIDKAHYSLLYYNIVFIMSRPENQLPPQMYYGEVQASKYQSNTRIQTIQRQIAERAIQLLDLQGGSYVMDIGCGSGISGETLTQNNYTWEGIDISRDMLNIAASKQDSNGGLMQVDIGQGWKVRPGVFDGAISISTIQWLCVCSKKNFNPFKRCCKFFQSLYESLRIGGRAVLQFYPDGKNQLQMITSAAMKSGFSGGLVIDYPNSTKAKKYYLVIQAGVRRNLGIVQIKGKTEEQQIQQQQVNQQAKMNKQKGIKFKKSKKKIIKKKDIVIKRKERLRRKGKAVKKDTKYTGRKRRPKF